MRALASIPFKLTGDVLWVLKCPSTSQYTLRQEKPLAASLSHFLWSFSLPLSSHAEENLSFIGNVMLSHLSQSLLLSCCIPSPSPLSPPVHLHTLLTGNLCMCTHFCMCGCACLSIWIHVWNHNLHPCGITEVSAQDFCHKIQRLTCLSPSPRFRPSQLQFPLTAKIHSTTSLP